MTSRVRGWPAVFVVGQQTVAASLVHIAFSSCSVGAHDLPFSWLASTAICTMKARRHAAKRDLVRIKRDLLRIKSDDDLHHEGP